MNITKRMNSLTMVAWKRRYKKMEYKLLFLDKDGTILMPDHITVIH